MRFKKKTVFSHRPCSLSNFIMQADINSTNRPNDLPLNLFADSWENAVSGIPYDAIFVGGGMYSLYTAEKTHKMDKSGRLRILVLEAGNFICGTHYSNGQLAPFLKNQSIADLMQWDKTWVGNSYAPGLVKAVGGRSLVWGGSSPRLVKEVLDQWHSELAESLRSAYPSVEREIGVEPGLACLQGELYQSLIQRIFSIKQKIPTLSEAGLLPYAISGSSIEDAAKWSPLPKFLDCLWEDTKQAYQKSPSTPEKSRRLTLVTDATVTRLHTDNENNCVSHIEARVNGQRQLLPIGKDTLVVLGASTVESTRLVLESFDIPLAGQNLLTHLRSDLTIQVPYSALSSRAITETQGAGILARGSTAMGRYHLQITAAAAHQGSKPETAYRLDNMLTDEHCTAADDEDSVVLWLRSVGEMSHPTDSSIVLSDQRDQFGYRKADVRFHLSRKDEALWSEMSHVSMSLAKALANGHRIKYRFGGKWVEEPPENWESAIRASIGSVHHESSTLRMGQTSQDSVCDLFGRLHSVSNVYCVGPAVFQHVGTANPCITALALCRRTAENIVVNLSKRKLAQASSY